MATASRYDTAATQQAANPQTGLRGTGYTQNGSTTGSQQSNTQSQQDTTSQQQSDTTSKQQTNTQNMTGSSLAALELLIQQLLGGGTQEQAVNRAQRQAEINQVQQSRAGYTKEAAFQDAQGLIAQTMQKTLEQLMPGINRGAAGSGTSQSSMRALLTQRAAEQASQAASAQGIQAATNYGQITSGLSGVLANLTQPDNSVTQALLQALGTAKGAITNSTTTGQQSTTTTGQQSTTGNQSTNQTSQQNQNQTTAPLGTGQQAYGAGSGNSQVDGLVYYGPQQSDFALGQSAGNTGSSLDTLRQLAGASTGASGWQDSFEF